MKFKGKGKTKGITLIALIITIIVMLILAGVSINAIVGDNGIVTKSMEASFKSAMSQYKDDTDTYVLNKQVDSKDYSTSLIFANDSENTYFTKQWVNVNALYNYTVTCDLMSNVTVIDSKDYRSHLAVYEGTLTWFTGEEDVGSNEVKWCLDLGLKVFIDGYGFYTRKEDGSYGFEVYSDGSYKDTGSGVYMCTPDLDGFNTASTYYLLYKTVDSETPTVGNNIYQDVPSDWYDYSSKKWANIETVSNAHITYLVWIPRYVYKIENGKVDTKFVNLANIYIDSSGVEHDLISTDGYQVPDAFTFGGQNLSGIWVTKYEISDPRDPVGFNATSDYESITVTSITWKGMSSADSTSTVVEGADVKVTIEGNNYTDSYRGQLPHTFSGLQKGKTYTVSVTTPTYYSEDMTLTQTIKTTEGTVAELTAPDLSGFNLDKTFYVTMSSTSTTPNVYSTKITTESYEFFTNKKIATNAPTDEDGKNIWYDYSSGNWANIVTIGNDGTAAYWVWIPRYEYKVDTSQNSVNIVFISPNQTSPDDGYTIPDAFTFGGQAVSGIWCAKYELSNIKIPTGFSSKVTSSSINIAGITYNGSNIVTKGEMPNTNIAMTCVNSSGTIVASDSITIDSTTGYTISGLSAGEYTISLTVPYAYSDPESGSNTKVTVTSKVTVPTSGGVANAPDVSGFVGDDAVYNASTLTYTSSTYAYYAIYDSQGRAVVGDRITGITTKTTDSSTGKTSITKTVNSTAPDGWYDYTSGNWANVVVSNSELTKGKIISEYGDTVNITMFVWIPRYEYKVDTSANTVHIVFLSGTTTSKDTGYSIPDAFKFGTTELSGFWCAKYEISDPSAVVQTN